MFIWNILFINPLPSTLLINTCVLGLCVGHLHGRGALGEGVEHSQTPVSQRWCGGVHHRVGTGVHHVTCHRRWHWWGDDGCWETHCCWRESRGRERKLASHWGQQACAHVSQQMALHISEKHHHDFYIQTTVFSTSMLTLTCVVTQKHFQHVQKSFKIEAEY